MGCSSSTQHTGEQLDNPEWCSKGESFQGTNYFFDHPAVAGTEERTVVCVHGIGSFNFHFESLSAHLTSLGFSVLRYDLIGRGHSDFPSDRLFTADAHIIQLRNLVEHLGISKSKYFVVGHSMGGALAALYTDRYIHEVAGLVLLAPAGLMNPGPIGILRSTRSTLGAFVKSAVLKPTQKSVWFKGFSDSERGRECSVTSQRRMVLINDLHPSVFDGFWESVMQFPLYGIDEVAARLGVAQAAGSLRVLIMWGDRDDMVPYAVNSQRWNRALTGSASASASASGSANSSNSVESSLKTVVYEGLDHAFFMEKDDEVNNEVSTFFSTQLQSQLQSHPTSEPNII